MRPGLHEGIALRLWRSVDAGHTWARLPTPRRWHEIRELTFDPVRPGAIYGIVNLHAVRSEDGGATWQFAIPSREVWNLAVLGDGTLLAAPIGPEDDDRVYGLLRSSDGGQTWDPSVDPGNPRTARPADLIFFGLAPSPSPAIALAAGFFGLWRTDDSGITWRPASRGIAAHSVHTLRASAGGEPRVYASTTLGFFARDERTGAWVKTYRGPIVPGAELHVDGFHDFQVDPRDSLHLVAYDRIELLESRDGGRSWRSLRLSDIAPNADVSMIGTARRCSPPGRPAGACCDWIFRGDDRVTGSKLARDD
ncbi:MAG TPA: sialidase family protein [Thermoanaerobaculia bacterium]|nr:sialidase family protein [Thermoanaerobaculia bacterium]